MLANLMLDYDIEHKSILEIECGIGLASLVLNKRKAKISATDSNPDVKDFLEKNVALNNGSPIPFTCTYWSEEKPELGLFDVIIGSDLLYEIDSINDLAEFIGHHSKPLCEVIIVDTGRFLHSRFNHRMEKLGFLCRESKPKQTPYLNTSFSGRILTYRRI